MSLRRRLILVFLGIAIIAISYESSFRYVTASCGEIDMEARPPRVYYSDDLTAPFPWRRMLYGFRTRLPLGKIKLYPDLYVDGGRFFRHLPDGGWRDLTDTMIQYQETKQ